MIEMREGLPLEIAPHGSETVWLLIDYSGCESWLPLEDKERAWTIGHRADGEDHWQFVGWSWQQDLWCDARSPKDGRVIGWAPFEEPSVAEAGAAPCQHASSWLSNCCKCGRVVDTRERDEGGDSHGAELEDGRWACSLECAESEAALRVGSKDRRETGDA